MNKKLMVLSVVVVMMTLAVIPAAAGGPGGHGNGGFDEWGYNYQAHMFNGPYCFYDRHYDPDHPDWNDGYCDIDLVMKWSEEWLNADRVRCAGTPQEGSSACEGAWLTNHQRGEYEYEGEEGQTCKWTYFVKIVYPPGGPVDADEDGYDDNTGGEIIWGSFVVIQEVSNDPCAGEHGNISSVQPTGFGAYK